MLRVLSLGIFLLSELAASTTILATKRHSGKSFISTLEFKITLRICNAYPYTYPMDVYLGKEKLTGSSLPYKQCGDFHPALKAGDKLDFKVQDASAGSFTVNELPQNDAVLFLVIFRHDTRSTAVKFESHVFANLLNAQIAVLDTYQGNTYSVPKIQDVKKHQEKGEIQRSEELRYNSVVAVNQGLYEVVLHARDETPKARHQLVALNRESYVVLRCGVEAEEGQAFPQELMVYPISDAAALGGAATYSVFAAALVSLFSLMSSL